MTHTTHAPPAPDVVRAAHLHQQLLTALLATRTASGAAGVVAGLLCRTGAATAAEVVSGEVGDVDLPGLVLASTGPAPAEGWVALPAGPAHVLRVGQPALGRAALQHVADACGLALARAFQLEQLHADAHTDPLTGLRNRRAFDEQLRADAARAARGGPVLALVLLDVDDLKVVNDEAGHPAGDRLLQRVATVLRRTVRTGDLAARIGGDEFALVLPGTDMHGAVAVTRRVHELLADATGDPPPSASSGVATTEHVEPSPDALLRAADRALYRAKALGKRGLATTDQVPDLAHTGS